MREDVDPTERDDGMDGHHIGIVAGTAEGAALCYRRLSEYADSLTSRCAHPQISLHAFPQSAYLDLIERDDWNEVASLMSQSATKLAQAGAGLIICPNNTLHRAFELVVSPAPWLHIADVVAAEAARSGYRRVGLLGTQVVMTGPLYPSKLMKWDIEPLMPDEDERIQIQHIIRTELIAGRLTPGSRTSVLKVIARMAKRGAEAVILGCTELPLLLSDHPSVLPLLDSTRLLAQAAIERLSVSTRTPGIEDHPVSFPDHLSHA